MSDCKYCRGTGVLYVERGSSLSYTCPDCNGSGIVADCDICGREYYGEYCENCYCECTECGEIGERHGDTDICTDCYETLKESEKNGN